MDKKLIFQTLTAELSKNLDLALMAAQATYDIATHEDNKAENKYDTRGLEASYLAGAQAERFRDLKETLTVIANLKVKDFTESDKIAHTALVQIEFNNSKSWLLLLPKGGGQNFIYEGKTIKVITPDSPLGHLLIGKLAEDSITLNGKEYLILSVL
jgi:hypothetical protein